MQFATNCSLEVSFNEDLPLLAFYDIQIYKFEKGSRTL